MRYTIDTNKEENKKTLTSVGTRISEAAAPPAAPAVCDNTNPKSPQKPLTLHVDLNVAATSANDRGKISKGLHVSQRCTPIVIL